MKGFTELQSVVKEREEFRAALVYAAKQRAKKLSDILGPGIDLDQFDPPVDLKVTFLAQENVLHLGRDANAKPYTIWTYEDAKAFLSYMETGVLLQIVGVLRSQLDEEKEVHKDILDDMVDNFDPGSELAPFPQDRVSSP